MAKENKLGLMELFMTVSGEMVWQRDKAHFIMPMAMFIPENSTKTERMDSENILIKMGRSMKGIGKMISKTDQEKRFRKMAQNMTECLKTVKNGVKVLFNGLTRASTSAIGSIMT